MKYAATHASLSLPVKIFRSGLLLAVTACASPQQTPPRLALPLMASMQPVAPDLDAAGPAEQPSDEEDVQDSAGMFLQRAFQHFRADRNEAASQEFARAIGTGNLNDAGRALAYWHIFVSERSVGHVDRSHEALASFVVVAEDVLDVRSHRRFAEDLSGDFVDRFDLERRLSRARAILAAAWARRSEYFGRSLQHAVRVRGRDEMRYFLDLMGPCDNEQNRRLLPHEEGAVVTAGLEPAPRTHMDHFIVSCNDGQSMANYYFEMSPEAASEEPESTLLLEQ